MTTKHTPGPWRARVYQATEGHVAELSVDSEDWKDLARVFVQEDDRFSDEPLLGSGEANARLIAAAPDLLAALEELMSCTIVCSPTTRERAAAAIARAKGEEA